MKTLALEFSSGRRSVAVLVGGVVRGEAHEAGGRHTRAFALMDVALRAAKIEREEIKLLAVGLGPGSYTGIRSAIAIAQGWQAACGVKLAGVNSVEAMASQAHAEGRRGRIHVLIDAQRGEFYFGAYDLAEEGSRLIEPLRIVTPEETRQLAQGSGAIVWPELRGAFPDATIIEPDAAMVGRLALQRGKFLDGATLEPVYLRPVQFVKAPAARNIPSV
jgi:tRNA threonylcarbamoyladenosine biosynthesis protein TsaB